MKYLVQRCTRESPLNIEYNLTIFVSNCDIFNQKGIKTIKMLFCDYFLSNKVSEFHQLFCIINDIVENNLQKQSKHYQMNYLQYKNSLVIQCNVQFLRESSLLGDSIYILIFRTKQKST